MENQDAINHEQEIKKVLSELLEKMGFGSSEVEFNKHTDEQGEIIVCNIKTDESNFLIGQHGVNLQSLQHIARILVKKVIPEKANFVLDVNSYRQEKNDSIIKLARNLAQEALTEKRAVVLRPMTPYERRIVHMELSKNEDIKTESIGEGEDRRVVIKPADLI